MKKLLMLFLFGTLLNALSFEDRQNKIFDIKQAILNEELEAKKVENYLETNYAFLGSMTQLALSASSLLSDQNIIDNGLDKLYKSDTFRERTFYYSVDGTIRIILKSDLSRHIYGLIKVLNSGNSISDCPANPADPANNVCKSKVGSITTIKISDTAGAFLYEYNIDYYDKGPMTITKDEALHTNEAFDLIPNGTNLIDENGLEYVKTSDGIVKLVVLP